ncbi:MAG: glycerophosphoryl diester phosphodiesterase [Planctomycetota bacterium]
MVQILAGLTSDSATLGFPAPPAHSMPNSHTFRTAALCLLGIGLVVGSAQPQQAEPIQHNWAQPMVIAHRGASTDAPENTLAAYALAVEYGARLAECDVYLTTDGVPVLFHDGDLERTTDAVGPVTGRSLAELKTLDAGSWKDPKYKGERIPTLVEFLRAVRGKLRPVIEIKGEQVGIAAAVIQALRTAETPSHEVMIFSFQREIVAEIARLDAHLPTTWLVSEVPEQGADFAPLMRSALAARVSALGVSHKHVTPDLLRQAHECGFPVFVWTVNDETNVKRLAGMGVDAIISDCPDRALRWLTHD